MGNEIKDEINNILDKKEDKPVVNKVNNISVSSELLDNTIKVLTSLNGKDVINDSNDLFRIRYSDLALHKDKIFTKIECTELLNELKELK